MRLALLICVTLAVPTAAFGGIVYDFTTTIETPRATHSAAGTVQLQGDCYRAEVQRDGVTDIVVSCDRDRTATFIDPRARTYRNRARIGTDIRSASIFIWSIADAGVKGKPKVTYKREETETIAGEPAVRHVIDASFNIMSRVAGVAVRGSYKVRARVWTAERLPKAATDRPIRSGYPEVDAELLKIQEGMQGMVLRSELEVVRRYEGGPPETEKTATTVTRMEEVEIPESQFRVPEGFTYAGPMTTSH